MVTDWANCLTPLLHYFSKSSFHSSHSPSEGALFTDGEHPENLAHHAIHRHSQHAMSGWFYSVKLNSSLLRPTGECFTSVFGPVSALEARTQQQYLCHQSKQSPSTGTEPSKQCSGRNGLGMDLARPVRTVPDSFRTQLGHYQDLLLDLMRPSKMVREEDEENWTEQCSSALLLCLGSTPHPSLLNNRDRELAQSAVGNFDPKALGLSKSPRKGSEVSATAAVHNPAPTECWMPCRDGPGHPKMLPYKWGLWHFSMVCCSLSWLQSPSFLMHQIFVQIWAAVRGSCVLPSLSYGRE